MVFTLDRVGKQYETDWLFRDLSWTFGSDQVSGITGANGSGKSTLLKILSGFVTPTEGSVSFLDNSQNAIEPISDNLSFAAPYIQAPADFSLVELLKYHGTFRSYRTGVTIDDLLVLSDFHKQQNRLVRELSSGMRQRLNLTMAMYTDSSLLLLDEPTSNLDKKYKSWFYDQLSSTKDDRVVVVATNESDDLKVVDKVLDLDLL